MLDGHLRCLHGFCRLGHVQVSAHVHTVYEAQVDELPGNCVFVCSTWGHNRVQEHNRTAPLQLILPVLTEPADVHDAVSALHRGMIQLSLFNFEAVLVLANAVGVSARMAQQSYLMLMLVSSVRLKL